MLRVFDLMTWQRRVTVMDTSWLGDDVEANAYYADTPADEFISDLYCIMKDGDGLTPEHLIADIVDMLSRWLEAHADDA
jgi:hypothetical protein